jgi:hypothetical protein
MKLSKFLIWIGWSPRPWQRCEVDYVTSTLAEIRAREARETPSKFLAEIR